ncbi:dTMP kinase [Elusimicrobiota bacterium]
MRKGLFITFEGIDGCGKSTQSSLFCEYLEREKVPYVYTREPGGTKISESIRGILLDPKNSISPLTELMLYEAGRIEHMVKIIKPALNNGKVVVCDRFTDATVAYQGYGRKIDLKIIEKLNSIATNNISPDLTILLDISEKEGLARAKHTKKSNDRMEQEQLSFYKMVRKGYLHLAKKNPKRIISILTTKTVEETQGKIINALKKRLTKYKNGF